jgi:putative phosphoesterase
VPAATREDLSVIAVVADTHMPKGARRLPARCVELIGEAEAVIHAGDFFGVSALEELRALCPVVHAVHGNVDEPALGSLELAHGELVFRHVWL